MTKSCLFCFLMSPAGSSRWCPTPEQLMILEEMYRSGIRTPNASQIQKITSHLSFFGKIEGKNVFYWFQNHKARDRQKLRKKLTKQLQLQQQLYHLHQLQQNYPNHHLPGSPAFQHLSYNNSASLFPQVKKKSVKEIIFLFYHSLFLFWWFNIKQEYPFRLHLSCETNFTSFASFASFKIVRYKK